MHVRFAQNIRPDQRYKIVSRQKLFDRPDAGIARLQNAVLLNTHRQAHTACADTFHFPDVCNEILGNVQFQHTHDLAPCLSRNYLLRLGQRNSRLPESSTKSFCRSQPARACSQFAKALVESKSLFVIQPFRKPITSHQTQDDKDQQHGCCGAKRPYRPEPIHEPYHAFVRAWSPRASRVETWRANAPLSFSRVRTRTSLHSERPALSSVCAGRFVSKVA